MANYVGRNRKRIQRDERKAAKTGKFKGTEGIMLAYGNKKHQQVVDNMSARQAK